MKSFGSAVVKVRHLILILSIILLVPSVWGYFHTRVNYDILTYLIQGGDLTMYGLSNAITRASQDCDSYDRATTLESLGWDVATMAPAQWREINNVSN